MFVVVCLVILLLYVNIRSGFGEFSNKDAIWMVNSIYKLCRRFMRWDTPIDSSTEAYLRRAASHNRVLCVSNHVAVVDFFHYIHLFRTYLPEHEIVMVTKKDVRDQPLVGGIVRSVCVIVEDDIPRQISRMTRGEKTVVLLFPEGKIFHTDSIARSNRWCSKKKYDPFSRVVCPHSKGLMTIIDSYSPDCMIGGAMYYADELYKLPSADPIHHGLYHGKEFHQFLTNQLPRVCRIQVHPLDGFLSTVRAVGSLDEGEREKDERLDGLTRQLWRNMDAVLRDSLHKAVYGSGSGRAN
jgi:hypothetical protein